MRPFLLYLLLAATCCFLSTTATATISPDWQRYEEVLSFSQKNPEGLADQIVAAYDTDHDRAAAIFYWLTNNIDYDVSLMRRVAGRNPRQRYTQEEIDRLYEDRITYAWENRRGVCENYARLFVRLAELSGLEAEMVTGHARGDYLQAGSLGIGHAWNAVKIDGHWQLLDATWGAGHLNEQYRFVAEFKPQFFLPDHRTFSYSHFPSEPDWQLLDEPVSKDQFLNGAAVGEGFLKYDLHDLSHPTYTIRAKRDRPLVITAEGTDLPGQFAVANLLTRKQIPGRSSVSDGRIRVEIPADQVRTMKLGILDPEGDIVLAYKIQVTR